MPINKDATPSRTPKVAHGSGYLLGVQRCPCGCGADLSKHPPIHESVIEAVEITARFAIDRKLTTSEMIGECLGITPEAASERLRAACETAKPLLVRTKSTGRYGGFGYQYWPTRHALAYLRQESLRGELLAMFKRDDERRRAAQAGASVTLGTGSASTGTKAFVDRA